MSIDSDSDNSDDDDDDLDEDPTIEHASVQHHGEVNRIRCMPQSPGIIATMAGTGKAHIYDLTGVYNSMQIKGPRAQHHNKAEFTFAGHRSEGFAVDWSPAIAGRLATGDCSGNIHIWNANASGSSWTVDATPYQGHTASVEDLQWSPTEATVFSSASADKTVRIFDTRGKTGPQITVSDAHTEDVNVLSWNRTVGYLLASASDDGSFKVCRWMWKIAMISYILLKMCVMRI